MSMKINHQLCSPETLKKEYPMADSLKALKQKRDEEIKAIFAGESDKFIVLIGPCSADNEDAVCEYVGRRALVTSHDRWFLDRIATHILAFEGDSQVVFFNGNYNEYEADKRRRLGEEAAQPKRLRFKPLKH